MAVQSTPLRNGSHGGERWYSPGSDPSYEAVRLVRSNFIQQRSQLEWKKAKDGALCCNTPASFPPQFKGFISLPVNGLLCQYKSGYRSMPTPPQGTQH